MNNRKWQVKKGPITHNWIAIPPVNMTVAMARYFDSQKEAFLFAERKAMKQRHDLFPLELRADWGG